MQSLDNKTLICTLEQFDVAIEKSSSKTLSKRRNVRDPLFLRNRLLRLRLVQSKEVLDSENRLRADLQLIHDILECSVDKETLHDKTELQSLLRTR